VTQPLDIAILGAGLGGLTAALALARNGHRVRVFEQAPALGEVGAGLTITPNAAKALNALGLGAELKATAQLVHHQAIHDALSGRQLMTIDRTDNEEKYGAGYFFLHRAELHAMLACAVEAAAPGSILTNHRLIGLAPDPGGVTLQFDGQPEARADLLIAADGARSAVRTLVFGAPPVSFTGHVAWRLLVPADAAPESARAPGSIVYATENRSFVRYTVNKGRTINCVGLTRDQQWGADSWSHQAPIAEFAAHFTDFPEEARALIAAAPEGRVNSWGLFLRPPADTYVSGRVALLGDAAHPMLPFMGQGAAMAIEDGLVLARALAAAATPEEGLARYNTARVERTHFVQVESAAGAARVQSADPSPERLNRNEDTLGIFHYDPATAPV
jgi:salicylate hydroxylase